MGNKTKSQEVTYTSPSRIIGLLGEKTPISGIVYGLDITETYISDTHSELHSGLGTYSLTLKAIANNQNDLKKIHDSVFECVALIDRIWIYVTSTPYSIEKIGTTRVVVDPTEAPLDWKTNAKQVEDSFRSFIKMDVRIESNNWTWLDQLPLKRTLEAIDKYERCPDEIRTIIDYHYLSFMTINKVSGLFLLAKSLEIIRAMLNGKTDQQKYSFLPEEIQKEMTKSLKWLFTIANNRREIRHAVKTPTEIQLHPEISHDEEQEFIENANLIIRYIVCKSLELPFFTIKDGNPDDTKYTASI